MTRLEHLDEEILEEAAARVPPQWYGERTDEMVALVSALRERRRQVAELILACQRSEKNPFPHWKDGVNSDATV